VQIAARTFSWLEIRLVDEIAPLGWRFLHAHGQKPGEDGFSEFQAGLDHIAFGCESRAGLEKWVNRLNELGIEHAGIAAAHYGSGLSVPTIRTTLRWSSSRRRADLRP
jgi:hypothetical protein